MSAEAFERCMSVGGVAVFPSDTVYGLACDAQNRLAVERLYGLKGRPLDKPSAVMFFDLELALVSLPELGPRTRDALTRLLPGPVSVLLPNPGGRFGLACGADPQTLGLRVPEVPMLARVRWPVLQSSANLAGQAEARRLGDVPEAIRQAADLLLDGGELPGIASTVVDLRAYEGEQTWQVVREGAFDADRLTAALEGAPDPDRVTAALEGAPDPDRVSAAPEGQFHFHADTYPTMIREDIPVYDRLQDELVQASGTGAHRVLELGTGTGETASRLLDRHPQAALVGVDESPAMLAVARARLPSGRVELRVGRLQQALPGGPFDLVASALCVHHLDLAEKQDLFKRVFDVLPSGGRFVLADVVVPVRAQDAVTPLTRDFDRPSTLADQLRWLGQAGFEARVTWEHGDLAVVLAEVA